MSTCYFFRVVDRHGRIHVVNVKKIVSISQSYSREFFHICFSSDLHIEITDSTMTTIYDYLQECHCVHNIQPSKGDRL